MQELYLLDTHSHALRCVARSTKDFAEISFSPASGVFLVLWQPNSDEEWDHHDQRFEVYSCSGQKISSFQDPKVYQDPPVAHLAGKRAAVAHLTTFSLWDLEKGLLLGTAGPGHDYDAWDPRNALIAADSASSRLVYCPVDSSTLLIYNAESLELMSTVVPGDGCLCQCLAWGVLDSNPGLVWGVNGWLMLHDVYDYTSGHLEATRPLELVQAEAGGSSYKVAQLGQSRGKLALTSCSPDQAFYCHFERIAPEIQVYDLRSGRIVLRHRFGPVMRGQAEPHYSANIHWSSCGRKIVVLLWAIASRHPAFLCEHLYVLQLW